MKPAWRERTGYSKRGLPTPQEKTHGHHQMVNTKIRLKLEKVGKTSKPFRYDLNQIPYDYTVEVRNRFKGLDLIECLKNYGWKFVTLYMRQESRPSPRKRNAKKQNGCLRRPYCQEPARRIPPVTRSWGRKPDKMQGHDQASGVPPGISWACTSKTKKSAGFCTLLFWYSLERAKSGL